MTLVSTVGGASGPLYGTFFLRMAGSARRRPRALDAAGFAAALRAGVEASSRAARPRPATRPCTTPGTRRCDALDAALADGAGLADGTGAAPPPRPTTGRDATESDAGAQGPGQLPRAAQRRPPGPGRDVGGAADRGRRRGARRLAGEPAVTGLVVVSHSRALAGRRSRWPPEMLHGTQVRIAVAAGLDDDDVRHRRRCDRRRDHRGRRRRRRGGADGPRQRGAVRRAGAGPARPRRPRAGRAVPGPAGRGPGRGGGRRGGRRRRRPRSPPRPPGRWPAKQSHLRRARPDGIDVAPTPADRRRPGVASRRSCRSPTRTACTPARAARLVQEVRRPTPALELRNLNTGSGSVPATQPVPGGHAGRAAAGHEVEVTATGQPGRGGARPRAGAGRAPLRRVRARRRTPPPAAVRVGRPSAPLAGVARPRDRAGARPSARSPSTCPTTRPATPTIEWRRLARRRSPTVRRDDPAASGPDRPRGRRGRGGDLRRPPDCCSTTPTCSPTSATRIDARAVRGAGLARRRVARSAAEFAALRRPVPAGPRRRRARRRRPGAARAARRADAAHRRRRASWSPPT